MRTMGRAAMAAALLLTVAVPATAQNHRGAFGVFGGGTMFTQMNLLPDEADDAYTDLSLDEGWLAGAQLEYWMGSGRFGLRLNGAFSVRPFDLQGSDFGVVNTYFGDASLMVRLLRPKQARLFAPYLALGGGMAHINPAGKEDLEFPTANAKIGDYSPDNNFKSRPTGVAAIGFDILPGGMSGNGPGIRFEVADHVALQSAFEQINGEEQFAPVHNLRATLGLHLRFGDLPPEMPIVAVRRRQRAEPEPEPTPRAVEPVEKAEPADNAEAARLAAQLEARNREIDRLSQRLRELERAVAARESTASARPATTSRGPRPSGRLFTVQVAAYGPSHRGMADQLAARLRQQNVPVWVSQARVDGRTVHRVRVGVLPSYGEAQRLGSRIRGTVDEPLWIAPVASSDPVTNQTVSETRAYLNGS